MNRLNAIALLVTGILLVFVQSYRAGLPRLAGVQIDLLPGLMAYAGIRASTRLIVGLAVLWPQILALLTWGVVIVALAVARSRKTLA